MEYPKISIITPSYNQSAYLQETIESVVLQNYPNLEYIIIDGGSTDGSVEIIKKYEQHVTYWVTEPDGGLYNALQKGFARTTGKIMGWLNADDLLHRKSLFTLAAIFTSLPQVNWVQGRPTSYNEIGMVADSGNPVTSPYHFYLKRYINGDFIQQESTFWRRQLWDTAGSYISEAHKYAGDFELWMRFFRYEKLYATHALIGGYRVRKNQLSRVFYEQYLDECSKIIDSETLDAATQKVLKQIRSAEQTNKKSKVLGRLLGNKHEDLLAGNNLITYHFDSGTFQLMP